MKPSFRILPALLALALCSVTALPVAAQEPLRINITQGVIDPMPFAVPTFIDEGGAGELARNLSRVVASDLGGTGLFREIPEDAHISRIGSFDGGVASRISMRPVPTFLSPSQP